MKIFIQNMVSLRCQMLVKSELEKLGIAYKKVELGFVETVKDISKNKEKELKKALHESGLEVMSDEKSMMIEKIIIVIVEMVHYNDELPKVNFSEYLQDKMKLNYHRMAETFSKTKGITIEHFIILHKIERIKELITYNQLNLTEISYKMNYSSVQHLSKQFKQITGLTPTFFKKLSIQKRNNLEDL